MQYSGGKSRTAKHLSEFVLSIRGDRQNYIEPFVGGGSMFAALAPHFSKSVASDASEDLALLWQAVADGWTPPASVSEEGYAEQKTSEPSPLRAFAGFGCSFSGKWFGGYARNNRGDDFCGAAARGLEKKRAAFVGAKAILHSDYRDMGRWMSPGVLAYCDPPYAGTLGYAAVGAWDADLWWKTAAEWTEAGALVLVSEYTAPTEWTCVWEMPRKMSMFDTDGNQKVATEKLFQLI